MNIRGEKKGRRKRIREGIKKQPKNRRERYVSSKNVVFIINSLKQTPTNKMKIKIG